jgi:hypothetical protein
VALVCRFGSESALSASVIVSSDGAGLISQYSRWIGDDARECGVEMSRLGELFVGSAFLGRADASAPLGVIYGGTTDFLGGYEYG